MLKFTNSLFFSIMVIGVLFLLLAKPTISLNPSKITFERLLSAAGIIIIMAGMTMMETAAEEKGEKEAYQKFIEKIQSKEWIITDSSKQPIDPSQNKSE